MNRGPLVIALALAFLAGAASLWIWEGSGSAARQTGSESPEPPSASPAELEVILRRLEEQSATLDGLAKRIEAVSAASPRQPLPTDPAPDEENEALAALLQQVQGSLDHLLEADRLDRLERMQRLREEHPDADWAALEPLVDQVALDLEQARKEVLLLSEEELVRRFGSPQLIYSRGNVVCWVYGRNYMPERDAYQLQVVFSLTDGAVISLHVER